MGDGVIIREREKWLRDRSRPNRSCLRSRLVLRVIRAVNEDQIPEIHHRSNRLSRDKHRIHSVDRIRERDQSADKTHVPEREGDAALGIALRGDPLNHPTAEEEPLTEEADTDPDRFSAHEVMERRISPLLYRAKGTLRAVSIHDAGFLNLYRNTRCCIQRTAIRS